jgi:hypothetical protein
VGLVPGKGAGPRDRACADHTGRQIVHDAHPVQPPQGAAHRLDPDPPQEESPSRPGPLPEMRQFLISKAAPSIKMPPDRGGHALGLAPMKIARAAWMRVPLVLAALGCAYGKREYRDSGAERTELFEATIQVAGLWDASERPHATLTLTPDRGEWTRSGVLDEHAEARFVGLTAGRSWVDVRHPRALGQHLPLEVGPGQWAYMTISLQYARLSPLNAMAAEFLPEARRAFARWLDRRPLLWVIERTENRPHVLVSLARERADGDFIALAAHAPVVVADRVSVQNDHPVEVSRPLAKVVGEGILCTWRLAIEGAGDKLNVGAGSALLDAASYLFGTLGGGREELAATENLHNYADDGPRTRVLRLTRLLHGYVEGHEKLVGLAGTFVDTMEPACRPQSLPAHFSVDPRPVTGLR